MYKRQGLDVAQAAGALLDVRLEVVGRVVVAVVALLLLFGGKKIPELMRGLGQGMKEFKDASKDLKDDSKSKDETKS